MELNTRWLRRMTKRIVSSDFRWAIVFIVVVGLAFVFRIFDSFTPRVRRWAAGKAPVALETGLHYQIDCAKVISGDSIEITRASRAKKTHWLEPDEVIALIRNFGCVGATKDLGFLDLPISVDVKSESNDAPTAAFQPVVDADEFPLAFIMIFHDDFEQSVRLLRALYRRRNVYCVQIDAKTENSYHSAFASLSSCLPNLLIPSRRLRIDWGDDSLLEAHLSCMEALLNSPVKWRYLLNLPGDAYPLRTVDEMVSILRNYSGFNDIHGTRILNHARWRSRHSPPPGGISLTKGSQYGAFSRAFIDFALRNETAQQFRRWLQGTEAADETFWASLHHDPKLGAPGGAGGKDPESIPFLATFVAWVHDLDKQSQCVVGAPADSPPCIGFSNDLRHKFECSSRHIVRGVCIFGLADLQNLVKLPHFQANKLQLTPEYPYKPLTYICLDDWYRNKSQTKLIPEAQIKSHEKFVEAMKSRDPRSKLSEVVFAHKLT